MNFEHLPPNVYYPINQNSNYHIHKNQPKKTTEHIKKKVGPCWTCG